MKRPNFTNRLVAIENEYDAAIAVLAEDVRRELVIPFCDRTGYRFSAGMGSWSFHKDGRENIGCWWGDGDLKKRLGARLYTALTLSVYKGQHLGSVTPDYHPPKG